MSMNKGITKKRTKIVCTIGPGTDAPGVLERMIASGMNVARFNFSHGTHEDHARRMQMVRQASAIVGIPVAILLDTKGPEMRLGTFSTPEVILEEGTEFRLYNTPIEGTAAGAFVTHTELWREVGRGQSILLADGLVRLRVIDTADGVITTTVENTGVISDRKRVACPSLPLGLPAVSAQDREDIHFGIREDIDYIAASFIQRAEDMVELKQFLEEEGAEHIRVLAKIENEEGVRHLDEILTVSDGLMIARGDLGVEIPPEQVPLLQKKMIQQCNRLGKPVITATQMLESMVYNPRPTRAETSDIANAILDGTDAVMLSGETANGKYPVSAVDTMLRVALSIESSSLYRRHWHDDIPAGASTTEAISQATVRIAEALGAKAVLTASESGRTALMVSKYRPACPIVAVSPHLRTIRRVTLYWGVTPLQGKSTENSDEMVDNVMSLALEKGVVSGGDVAVVTAGVQSGREGTTNMIRVQVAGVALCQGTGFGGRETGAVCRSTDLRAFTDGDILVAPALTKELLPYARRAGALVTEEAGLTSTSAIMGLSLGKPTVIGVADAMQQLHNGDVITVDAASGRIFAAT